MSWPKLQMWQPTSLYGLSEKGTMGTKQKVNHSQRFIIYNDKNVSGWKGVRARRMWGEGVLEGGGGEVEGWVCGRCGRRTRPEKFPQFWHCTVMCSAPERALLKTGVEVLVVSYMGTLRIVDEPCVPHVKKKNMIAGGCGALRCGS